MQHPPFSPADSNGINGDAVLNAIQPESDPSSPLGGTHHCIATAYAAVNAVFRHLRSECDLNGGSLTDSELETVRFDFIDKLKFAHGLFDGIHARCMRASHATAPMLLMKGQILSSLLLACSPRAAQYAFRDQISRFGVQWLNLFYGALSLSLAQRSEFDVESRLTEVYITTSCELGRDLSVGKLLRKRAVRKILRDALATFRSTDWSEEAVARLNGEIHHIIGETIGTATPLCGTTDHQMRDFVRLFLQELDGFLGGPADRTGSSTKNERKIAAG